MGTRSAKRGVLAFALAALLSGCAGGDGESGAPRETAPTDNGISALPPNEILERAKTALEQAKSYRVKGNINAEGQRMSLDFRVSGTNLGGRLVMNGANVDLLSVAGQQYMRPDRKFWVDTVGASKADEIVKLMGNKWAKVPPENKDFADLFGIASVEDLLKPDGSLTKGQPKDIDGVKTIGLVDGGADGGTLYVATTGEPYPVRLESRNATEGGQITFSDFGATFDDLTAPPESEVIDFEQLARN
jgi:hypothetical protein